MLLSDLNPHIRYAAFQESFPGKNNFTRICYDCRLFYIEKGTGYFITGGEKYPFTPQSAIYFPPLTKYNFSIDTDSIHYFVANFDLINDFSDQKHSFGITTPESFFKGIAPEYDICEPLTSPILCSAPQISNHLFACADNFLKKRPLYREKSSALLKMCLLECVYQNTSQTEHSELCDAVLNYIYTHYNDPKVTNSDIAETFSYHPYHLSRILKQETGMTLHQYLIYYRIRIAKNLLATTRDTIENIAWKSGFTSTAYFIRLFREATGITPKKFRNQHNQPEL